MPDISATMTHDHRHCDELFAAAEEAVSQGDWEAGGGRFASFREAMEQHFRREEEVLFPAFEARTSSSLGPTQVMRMEHRQMRQLFDKLAQAVAQRDADGYLGDAETLMILIQQHNMKEEQILYRMADQTLGDEAEGLLGRMRQV